MSPNEWAVKIQELIEQAENDGMRFHVRDGDFRVYAFDPGASDEDYFASMRDSVFIW